MAGQGGYTLARPDKAALGRYYKDKQGIFAFILGNLGNNNRTAMGRNQARVFLDENYTNAELKKSLDSRLIMLRKQR